VKSWIGRSVVAALLLTFVQAVLGAVLLREAQVSGSLAWSVGANVLTALLLTLLASRLALGGVRLAGALFLVVFGIPANNLVELFFFDIDVGPAMLLRLYIFHFLVGAVLAAFVAWQTASSPSDRRRVPGAGGFAARIVGGGLAYVLVYFAAGMAAFPFIADFYAGRAMPGVGELALVQLFRGAAFTAIGAAIVIWTATSRRRTALVVGLTFSILGGVAPLLLPNPFMPAPVRMVHLVEVGVSNFLFGVFVGWLFSRRRAASPEISESPDSDQFRALRALVGRRISHMSRGMACSPRGASPLP